MSAKVAQYKYSGAHVHGSMAYDMSREEFWPEYDYSEPLDIPVPQEIDEDVVEDIRAVSTQGVSPTAILGFAFAALLIVFSLFARIQLSTLSDQCATLETTLAELSDQRSKLRISYESAFNLTEIEDYAIDVLGMQKPLSDQILYINTNSEDKAEVLSRGEDVGIADRIGDRLTEFLAYFTGFGE